MAVVTEPSAPPARPVDVDTAWSVPGPRRVDCRVLDGWRLIDLCDTGLGRVVAPVQPTVEPENFRAFYSDGSTGICMKLLVWHTMPVCLKGEEVYLTSRGDQDYHQHSVEIDFDLERGQSIAPDMANFAGA